MSVLTAEPRAVARTALEIALAYAAAHVHEEGGNNRGDQVEFFQRLMHGVPGDPWCADFVCTCLVKGFARHRGLCEDRRHLPGYVKETGALLLPLSGYCPALAEAARRRYMFRSSEFTPQPGDLVLFDFQGPVNGRPGEPHHVGFVRSFCCQSIDTVEGNTSSGECGSQMDGGGVYLKTRLRRHVFGFVHFG